MSFMSDPQHGPFVLFQPQVLTFCTEKIRIKKKITKRRRERTVRRGRERKKEMKRSHAMSMSSVLSFMTLTSCLSLFNSFFCPNPEGRRQDFNAHQLDSFPHDKDDQYRCDPKTGCNKGSNKPLVCDHFLINFEWTVCG